MNADDLGLTRTTTDAIVESYRLSRISSATAMVYMEDSRRAASLLGSCGLPIGLHLNVSTPFTATDVPPEVRERHQRVVHLFKSHRFIRWVYLPGFRDLISACVHDQRLAFHELFKHEPTHCDGHHFYHLAPNILLASSFRTMPKIRKSLTFRKGEKSFVNRWLRTAQNTFIERRHLTVDEVRLFSEVAPRLAEPACPRTRLEVVVHPELAEERRVLLSDEWPAYLARYRLGSYVDVD